MPGMDGFKVLESLSSAKLSYIVFVTAYDQYALKAFDVYALDYLLKPFNEERLLRSVKRIREKFAITQREELRFHVEALLKDLQTRREFKQHLLQRENHRSHIIKVEDIRWICAEKKRSRVYLQNKSYLLPQSLQDLEASLDPHVFIRISLPNCEPQLH
jgi:two-component system, LytTR family, response regulator